MKKFSIVLLLATLVACSTNAQDLTERGESDLQSAANAPFFSYFGGAVDTRAEIIPIYWGSNVSFASQLDGFYSTVASSSYVTGLAEYSVPGQQIGAGHLGGSVTDTAASPASVSDEQARGEILALIGAGRIPPPNGKRIYMVHLPPGVVSTISGNGLPPGFVLSSCVHYCAYHLSFDDPSTGAKAFYSVIPDQTGGASCSRCAADTDLFANTTRRASHQISVNISDPDSVLLADTTAPTAWLDHESFGEIADGQCEDVASFVGPYKVQGWWSNKRGACSFGATLAPTDFNVIPASPLVTLAAGHTTTVHVALSIALPGGYAVPVHLSASSPSGVTVTIIGANTRSDRGANLQITVSPGTAIGELSPIVITATQIGATSEGLAPATNFSEVFVTVVP